MMDKTPSAMPGVSVHCGGEHETPTANTLSLQLSSVGELRALHLIASRHVRPELALALAPLAFGGDR